MPLWWYSTQNKYANSSRLRLSLWTMSKSTRFTFVAIAPIETKYVEVVQGHALCSEYFATANKKRVFCKICGSPLFSARLDLPEVVRLRVGLINEVLNAKIASHAFTSSKAAWFEILDDAEIFHEGLV